MTVKELQSVIKEFKEHVASQFLLFGDTLKTLEESITSRLESHAKSITDDILQIRSVHIANLVQQNKLLQRKNYELEARVTEVEDRLARVERQVNQVEANNRKSNIEIDGIPNEVDDESLKAAVLRIMNFVTEENYSFGDIEACHRLGSGHPSKPTIVRLRRNVIEKLKLNSKKLKGVDVALNFRPGTKIYIKDNQSPTMRNLAKNARSLKKDGIIDDTWFANAAVRVKVAGKTHKITHETDLIKLAPEYQDFSFDPSFGGRILYENPDFMDLVRMDKLYGVGRKDSEFDPEEVANSVRPLENAGVGNE